MQAFKRQALLVLQNWITATGKEKSAAGGVNASRCTWTLLGLHLMDASSPQAMANEVFYLLESSAING